MLRGNNEFKNKKFVMTVSYKSNIDILFSDATDFIKNLDANKKIIFIDPIVLSKKKYFLQLESSDPNFILIPININEKNKNIDTVVSILKILEEQKIGRRNDAIFAVGGGTLMDAVSFAASIFRRGIFVYKIPTTLLGVVDASIGIKTGVNFLNKRNRIGSYHIDYKVVIDIQMMDGLSKEMLTEGLGEIFKIAIIKSESLFDDLVKYSKNLKNIKFYQSTKGLNIIKKSIRLMLEELHNNPKEEELKRCVDFGHSFCPLIEMESIRRPEIKALPHGFVVVYDCLLTSTISLLRKKLSNENYLKIIKLCNKFNFNLNNSVYEDTNLMWESFMDLVKHRGEKQNLPIPTKIGSYLFLQDVTYDEMVAANNFLRKHL
jgi:3-dehydroquinate synthetase